MKMNKYTIGALVAAVFIVGGFVIYQQLSSNKINPLSASANYATMNWYHTRVPFSKTITNIADPIYTNSIKSAVKGWSERASNNNSDSDMEKTAAFSGKVIGTGSSTSVLCPMEYGLLKFCSVTDYIPGAGVLSIFTFNYNNNNNIYQAAAIFNDGTLINDPTFATTEYRNAVACWLLVNVLKATFTDPIDPPPIDSCMQGLTNPETIAKQQSPHQRDINRLYNLYMTTINTTPDSAEPPAPSNYSSNDLGEKIATSADGLQETYELDLGNGHKKRSVILYAQPVVAKSNR